MHLTTFQTLQQSHERLLAQLEAKQNELARRRASQGTSHDVSKMNRLVEQIAGIKARLTTVEGMLTNAGSK